MLYRCLMQKVKEKVQIFVHPKPLVPHILRVRSITSKSIETEICGDNRDIGKTEMANEIGTAGGKVKEEEMIEETGRENELVAEEEGFQIHKIYATD